VVSFLSTNEVLIVVLVLGFFGGLIWSTFYGLFRAAKTQRWGWFWGILIAWTVGFGWLVGVIFLLGPAKRAKNESLNELPPGIKVCASCGTASSAGARFCGACGAEVS